jgi:phosphotransferase system HPr (HPr) family protein
MSGELANGRNGPGETDGATAPRGAFQHDVQVTAMNGEPLKTRVTINNPQGFHMRPQAAFAQLAGKFQSNVFLYDGQNQKFDGKSPFSLLGLLAENGTELTLEVGGPDQDQAFAALIHLMANLSQFEEDPNATSSQ